MKAQEKSWADSRTSAKKRRCSMLHRATWLVPWSPLVRVSPIFLNVRR